jgi:hypothetical protein
MNWEESGFVAFRKGLAKGIWVPSIGFWWVHDEGSPPVPLELLVDAALWHGTFPIVVIRPG